MDSTEQINIIREFCECILDKKKDSSDFLGLTDSEKFFCSKHHEIFDELGNGIEQETIITIVRVECDKYCKKMMLENTTPFIFYNNKFVDNYSSAMKEYCKKNYNVDIPLIIDVVLSIIGLECLEYQNTSLHIQQAINNNINSHVERMNGIDERINSVYNTIEAKTTETANMLKDDFNKVLEENTKKYNESSIAVLGIFSAVVLTFNAALTFTSSVLENISKSSIYRISFISLLIGFVLINVFYGLFTFIKSIIKSQEKQKISTLIVTDALILIMMGILIFSWFNGFSEERNKKIENATTTTCVSENTNNKETTIKQEPLS